MPRKYSPTAKRKRDEAFLKNLARRENPIRYLVSLPVDVSDLDGISWNPSREEILFTRLAAMKLQWAADDVAHQKLMDALRQKHINAIFAQVASDRVWLAQMNAWEEEIERRRNFYLTEHAKEEKAIHAAQLAKLAEILTDIRKDAVRHYCDGGRGGSGASAFFGGRGRRCGPLSPEDCGR
jgi:hypothetical protein